MMDNVTTMLLVQLLLKPTERYRIKLCQNMSKPFSFSLSNVCQFHGNILRTIFDMLSLPLLLSIDAAANAAAKATTIGESNIVDVGADRSGLVVLIIGTVFQ